MYIKKKLNRVLNSTQNMCIRRLNIPVLNLKYIYGYLTIPNKL